MEPIILWRNSMGWRHAPTFWSVDYATDLRVTKSTEYAALPRADFDALAADAAETRTLRAERDSLRQERDEAQHWRERHSRDADAAGKRVVELWEQLRAATARADRLAALLREARPCIDSWRRGYPDGLLARIDAEVEEKKGQTAPTPTHPTNHAPKATSADATQQKLVGGIAGLLASIRRNAPPALAVTIIADAKRSISGATHAP